MPTKSSLCFALTLMLGATCLAQTTNAVSTNAASAWTTDIAAARALSKSAHKPIYVFITDGSKDCEKVQKSLLESGLFQRFAKDNFVLLRLDVPNVPKKEIPKHIDTLLAKVAHKYPGMILLDAKEKCIAKVTYQAPRKISDYLFDLKDILEKKDYSVDASALEGLSPPKLPTPTKK